MFQFQNTIFQTFFTLPLMLLLDVFILVRQFDPLLLLSHWTETRNVEFGIPTPKHDGGAVKTPLSLFEKIPSEINI